MGSDPTREQSGPPGCQSRQHTPRKGPWQATPLVGPEGRRSKADEQSPSREPPASTLAATKDVFQRSLPWSVCPWRLVTTRATPDPPGDRLRCGRRGTPTVPRRLGTPIGTEWPWEPLIPDEAARCQRCVETVKTRSSYLPGRECAATPRGRGRRSKTSRKRAQTRSAVPKPLQASVDESLILSLRFVPTSLGPVRDR